MGWNGPFRNSEASFARTCTHLWRHNNLGGERGTGEAEVCRDVNLLLDAMPEFGATRTAASYGVAMTAANKAGRRLSDIAAAHFRSTFVKPPGPVLKSLPVVCAGFLGSQVNRSFPFRNLTCI